MGCGREGGQEVMTNHGDAGVGRIDPCSALRARIRMAGEGDGWISAVIGFGGS
jgi:hypothetical protein